VTQVSLGPEDYVPILKRFGVTAIVRLNKKVYDRKKFLDEGIKHYDMYFIDGGNPTDAIIKNYIDVVENEKGAVGIHCKAGLGRTGVLNGCYLMKHYRLSANELIAWMRICRPGTVIGPQQQFLKEMEPKMWREGDLWRQQHGNQPPQGGTDLAPVPEGWYDQPDARCDQDEDMCAAAGTTVGGIPTGPASAAPSGSNHGHSFSAYAGYQQTCSPQAAPRAGGYSSNATGGNAAREAPTRASGYGSSMASRSAVGISPYGGSANSAAPQANRYARAAPAPVGGSYGGSRSTGTRYY